MGRLAQHSEEFRRGAIALVRSSGKPIVPVAGLGVNRETLRSWVRWAEKHQALASTGLGQAELEELRRLRRYRSVGPG